MCVCTTVLSYPPSLSPSLSPSQTFVGQRSGGGARGMLGALGAVLLQEVLGGHNLKVGAGQGRGRSMLGEAERWLIAGRPS